MQKRWIPLLAAAMLSGGALASARAGMPDGFVYLRDVDPTIVQEIRYAGYHNFVGRPVRGYGAAECILSRKAALALVKVQERLRRQNLSLKVYDCYRPARAVLDFANWAQAPGGTRTKAEFYPLLAKSRLFREGYISKRSRHSVGSAVDLTIVPLPVPEQPRYDPDATQAACHLSRDRRFPDNSLDFGTGYDCFHPLSHTGNPNLPRTARFNRFMLVSEMRRVGFKNYHKEWWHFELVKPPFGGRRFDFPILPRGPDSTAAPATETASLGRTIDVKPTRAPAIRRRPTPIATETATIRKKSAEAKTAAKSGTEKAAVGLKTSGKAKPHRTYRGSYRIICGTDKKPVPLRGSPGQRAKIVYRVYGETTDVRLLTCRGKLALADWRALDEIGKMTVPAPHCRVVMPGDGATGWVDGKYLLRQTASTKDVCLP